jgi:ribonucleoside-diphosphate reductase alpha chain
MLIEFEEILGDLELKRAAALEPSQRPAIDVRGALAEGVIGEVAPGDSAAASELHVREESGQERAFTPAMAGQLVADALSTLAAARGELQADTAVGREILRATTSAVVTRLAGLSPTVITGADLSALVEAALIDAGHYEVAKALVVTRTLPGEPSGAATGALRLIRRSGEVVPWSTAKIEAAVHKAFISLQRDPDPATNLAARVAERAKSLGTAYVAIETIQDIVQEELVLAGHMRVAERYIVRTSAPRRRLQRRWRRFR